MRNIVTLMLMGTWFLAGQLATMGHERVADGLLLVLIPLTLVVYFTWPFIALVFKDFFLGFFVGKGVKASGVLKQVKPVEPPIMNPLKQSVNTPTIEIRPERMFIYVIKGGSRIKIGRSSDPDYRCATLQTGNPDRLELYFAAPVLGDGRAVETAAHDILLSNRIRQNGEWFDVTPEVAIAAIRSAANSLNQPLFKLEP